MSQTGIALLLGYASVLVGIGILGHKERWKRAVVRIAFLVALIPAGVALVFLAGLWLQAPSSAPQKDKMLRMAEQLNAADRKGDRSAAENLLDSSIEVFRALNPTGTPAPDRRDCLLAATHLSDGISQVMNGGHWTSRSRFDVTIAECNF